MNDLMSMGIHRIWNDLQSTAVRSSRTTVVDIVGGTYDLTAKFSKRKDNLGRSYWDINDSMLKVGRDKLTNKGIVGNVEYVQANAEALPFPDNSVDLITIAFGLRNVTDKDKALASMYRILKPGGRLLVPEFSSP